ncbi:MAG: homoserine O-succinyltransferase [Candidatus Sulfotelmatobacter sp.]
MPLLMNGSPVPPRWAEKIAVRAERANSRHNFSEDCVRIALVNNMPDAALEDTETQFMDLLDAASGDIPVRLKLYSLPLVPRGARGALHLSSFYHGIDDLWDNRFDAIIVTGTEPRQPSLRLEPYWHILTDVLDWAESSTASTVLSCLAAHAGVLHSDGIQRRPLSDKQFGVFESTSIRSHELTKNAARPIRFPHSRWNEVPEDSLTSCGYSVLTKSTQAGVDLFVKQRKQSLFVHFQGHPEYGTRTLLKEYRRDIKRFLRQERETYPNLPHGYFTPIAANLLAEFKQIVLAHPRDEQMVFFPEALVTESLQNTWQSSAVSVYRNWLHYLLAKKNEKSTFAAMSRIEPVQSTLAESERA